MSRPVAGDMVLMAREARGLSQDTLAKNAGIPQAQISRIENGTLEVDDERLARLAAVLRYPPSLFAHHPRRVVSTAAAFFRKRASVSPRRAREMEAQANMIGHHASRLLAGLDIDYSVVLRTVDLDDYEHDIQAAADAVRAGLQIPMGPIRHLVTSLEASGVIIVYVPPRVTGFDGVSLWLPNGQPLILVNGTMPGDRCRYTIAHELGHLVLHHGRYVPRDPEGEANDFASGLLMPAREIKPQLVGLTVERALRLKPAWGVSAAALIMRARGLGTISPRTASRLFAHLRSLTGSVREGVELDREPAQLMSSVVKHLGNENGMTPQAIADRAEMPLNELIEFFAPDIGETKLGHLRVV